jgi:hypothetical protein
VSRSGVRGARTAFAARYAGVPCKSSQVRCRERRHLVNGGRLLIGAQRGEDGGEVLIPRPVPRPVRCAPPSRGAPHGVHLIGHRHDDTVNRLRFTSAVANVIGMRNLLMPATAASFSTLDVFADLDLPDDLMPAGPLVETEIGWGEDTICSVCLCALPAGAPAWADRDGMLCADDAAAEGAV